MKPYRYIIALLAAVSCLSCVKPFDLDLDDDPIICLDAFPGIDDVVVFNIRPAYSLSNSAVRPEFDPEIVFTVNGKAVPVEKNTGFKFGESYPEDVYIADYKPVPGDEMIVEVSSEGFSTIHARTSIPLPFPERKIDYRQVDIGDREYYLIYVTFNDDSRTDYSYGLSVLNESIYYWEGREPEVNAYSYAGSQISDDFALAPESLDGMNVSFSGWKMNSSMRAAACWDGSAFNGQEKTLSMTVVPTSWQNGYEYFFERESTAYRYDDYGEVLEECRMLVHNKILMYSMSDEFYKYAVAQELISDNAGVFAGIAPSNFCYSNVENGYGAFAGVYCVETDWITPEFIENNR